MEGFVFPSASLKSLQRCVKANGAEERQRAAWHLSQAEPLLLKETVCCCAHQQRQPLLSVILSMSQRSRSFKITRRDRQFFPSFLFVIRCQQNFLGVKTTPFMSEVSHGVTAYQTGPFKQRAKKSQNKAHKHESTQSQAQQQLSLMHQTLVSFLYKSVLFWSLTGCKRSRVFFINHSCPT